MDQAVGKLKGLGPAKTKILESWDIHTIGDLLNFFPRRYIDKSRSEGLTFAEGKDITTFGTVGSVRRKYARRAILEVSLQTEGPAGAGSVGHDILLVFFKGIPYFERLLVSGVQGVFSGKLKKYGRRWQIVHPEFEITDDGGADELTHVGRIVPLYPSSEAGHKAGLDSRGIRRLVKQALDRSDIIIDDLVLPSPKGTQWLHRRAAYTQMHFPDAMEDMDKARERFVFEEFFFFHLMMLQKKRENQAADRSIALKAPSADSSFQVDLPFTLTDEQQQAIDSILEMAKGKHPYSVLLQGDVGSGKTAVVLKVAERYIQSGYQVAFLAPTEVLARQHFDKISDYLPHFMQPVELFVGKEKAAKRRQKLAELASGQLGLAVGTHALIQDEVSFANLGLVIIDEQHRFGVKQREQLRQKGAHPDLIATTATPIPRTLAMSLYSNLETVFLRNRPAGRGKIDTKWFGEERLEGILKGVIKYVSQGQQAYIVYPLIEESEKIDLTACTEEFAQLSTSIFKDYKTGLLHGRLSADEKTEVMDSFRRGQTQILFSTTVIEVGVDVPNATVMVIRNAERFGLSALHQLRGRVGRGTEQSFCILVSSPRVTEEGRQRLQAMVDSDDGFYLAEVDLKVRGPGEVLGLRQSGLPEFKLADFVDDAELCRLALDEARRMGPAGLQQYQKELETRFAKYESIYA